MVEISAQRYAELIDDEEFLNALRAAGVDNWEGYNYAIDYLREEHDGVDGEEDEDD